MAVMKYIDPTTGATMVVGMPKSTDTFREITMVADGWTDKTYSFEGDYPHTNYNITVEVAPTATIEQFEAFCGAMICGSANSNVATALGDVPTADIPIIIKVVAK